MVPRNNNFEWTRYILLKEYGIDCPESEMTFHIQHIHYSTYSTFKILSTKISKVSHPSPLTKVQIMAGTEPLNEGGSPPHRKAWT